MGATTIADGLCGAGRTMASRPAQWTPAPELVSSGVGCVTSSRIRRRNRVQAALWHPHVRADRKDTMNPRQEAFDRLGGRYEVRVLEPSPPAAGPPWWADDPAVPGPIPPNRQVVTPTTAGDLTWDALAARDDHLGAWCAERWLGAWSRLGPVPEELSRTRAQLHGLAEHVLAPARHRANGKIGLRYTRGGFGTPFYGDDAQIRLEGIDLIVQERGQVRRQPLTTVRAAAELAGVDPGAPAEVYTPSTAPNLDRPLDVDADAAAFLADWYGFVTSILEQLRVEVSAGDDPSRVQLWPEHFDPAVDIGREDSGARASFGGSPGDVDHPEPYLYVAPWSGPDDDPYWNDTGFGGARLDFAALAAAADQREAGLAFLRHGHRLLAARQSP